LRFVRFFGVAGLPLRAAKSRRLADSVTIIELLLEFAFRSLDWLRVCKYLNVCSTIVFKDSPPMVIRRCDDRCLSNSLHPPGQCEQGP
jgi:hypothetical protein